MERLPGTNRRRYRASPRAGDGQQKDILPHTQNLANNISGSGGAKSTMGIRIFGLGSSQVKKGGEDWLEPTLNIQ
jgi:hypothetical protein